MPYDNAAQLIDDLNKLTVVPTHQAFSEQFILTLNSGKQVAKMITTDKLELAANREENVLTVVQNIALDVVGLVVPTGTLGQVTNLITSALFKHFRKKGYEGLAEHQAHQTHVEITSQALAFAMLLHYRDSLNLSDTKAARKRGKDTAKKLLKWLKKESKASQSNDGGDQGLPTTLADGLARWLPEIIQRGYALGYEMPKSNEAIHLLPKQSITDDDYVTLVLLASAELFGLPLATLVNQQELQAAFPKLQATVESHETRIKVLEEQQAKLPKFSMIGMAPGSRVKDEAKIDLKVVQDGDDSIPQDSSDKDIENVERLMKLKHQHTNEVLDKLLGSNISMVGMSPNSKAGSAKITGVLYKKGGTAVIPQHNLATQVLPNSVSDNIEVQDKTETTQQENQAYTPSQ